MPRAVRPLNARVSAVGASPASASRWTGAVPASGVRRNAVPSWAADRGVWERAIALAHEPAPLLPERFIHRDFHPGNTLWEGAQLTGIVDWTTGSRGPGAVDLGHLRWNLVVDHGQRVADALLPHPEHHPYYDVVTVLDVLPELDPTDTHAELLRLEDHVARALAEL